MGCFSVSLWGEKPCFVFLDVNSELLQHLELTPCSMCVFSASDSTVDRANALRKLLQICQTAEQRVLAVQRRDFDRTQRRIINLIFDVVFDLFLGQFKVRSKYNAITLIY